MEFGFHDGSEAKAFAHLGELRLKQYLAVSWIWEVGELSTVKCVPTRGIHWELKLTPLEYTNDDRKKPLLKDSHDT